jgi:hypothetical protein
MEATVIMAKCKVSKEGFGIRAQKQRSSWLFTWAFQLSDKAARNEGYDNTNVSGSIGLDGEYPGCPHCGASNFYQCGSCKRIVCYVGNEETAKCPHCGITAGFRQAESFDGISGGAF